MVETRLFLFRHGETDWNRERRFQGHTDIPLNADGREQAKTLTLALSTLGLESILTSDLMRAKETAEIANATLRLPLQVARELRECKLGDPEGMLRDKIVEAYGAPMWDRWLSVNAEDQDFGFPNGETKNDHLRRLRIYLEAYCLAHPHFKKIGVSTHGGSVRRLVHHCAGAPHEAIPLPNCALYEVSFHHETRQWNYGIQHSNSGDGNVWAK
jgi:probable phosphoglycerate mutase